jgi:hypothetical protein
MARIWLPGVLWLLSHGAQAQVVAEVGGQPVEAADLVDREPAGCVATPRARGWRCRRSRPTWPSTANNGS